MKLQIQYLKGDVVRRTMGSFYFATKKDLERLKR
jgi:hypothetical protein